MVSYYSFIHRLLFVVLFLYAKTEKKDTYNYGRKHKIKNGYIDVFQHS